MKRYLNVDIKGVKKIKAMISFLHSKKNQSTVFCFSPHDFCFICWFLSGASLLLNFYRLSHFAQIRHSVAVVPTLTGSNHLLQKYLRLIPFHSDLYFIYYLPQVCMKSFICIYLSHFDIEMIQQPFFISLRNLFYLTSNIMCINILIHYWCMIFLYCC